MSFDSKRPEDFYRNLEEVEPPKRFESDAQQAAVDFFSTTEKRLFSPNQLINLSSLDMPGSSNLFIQDSFFSWVALGEGLDNRHNQLWPYELVITDVTESGNTYTVARYIMPLPPNAINVATPTAGDIGVTLNGIYEEHNAAPLRNITVSGNTGIQPFAIPESPGSSSDSSGSEQVFGSIFSNTLSAFDQLSNTTNRISSLASGNTSSQSKLQYNDTNELLKNTGYAWFHKLSRFLDYYLALKKTERGRSIRLLFLMHKDKQYYSCFLRNWNYQKAAGTLEYKYSLNLVAWKRYAQDPTRDGQVATFSDGRVAPDINDISRAIQIIRESRQAISDSINVIRGIRQDVSDTFIKPLKEASLLLKEVTGLPANVYDLASSSIQSLEREVTEVINNLEQSSTDFQQKVIQEMLKSKVEPMPWEAFGGDNRSTFGQDRSRNESFSKQENIQGKPSASPTTQVFNDPDRFVGILEEINIDDLNTSQETSRKINEEISSARNLNADYFKQRKSEMENLISSITDYLGGGDSTYRRIKDLPNPRESFTELSVSDALLLSSFEDAIQSIDTTINFLQDQENNNDSAQGYYDFFANLAISNNIPFDRAASRFYVPFPHNGSLDQLAATYLGDSNRWLEIAALNGLKEPYVDEEGFDKTFLSSAVGNTIILSDSDSLFINQKIIIKSDTTTPTIRKILRIDRLSANKTLIEVDGESNLSKYTTQDDGRVTAFLPNTVNSNNYIAIPSIEPVNVEGKFHTNPDPESENPRLIQMAKVDFKLSSSGDLALTSSGDILLSFGLANLVQAANIKLRTPTQSILSDPSFGNPIQVGSSIADTHLQRDYKKLEALFISDPRFTRVPSLRLLQKGSAISIDILLGIANTGIFLPVTAEVPR